ncbi:hypothetical protein EVAR_41819_1 [Eumeta japonica]|uniref:Uncharacterized protein n=1 Tax=Eumeta variegata TaxID=151549 RepID=A0A4C1XAL7_EUMVA|nr:hypothetical protein EVAR_41819_1 [Eumeta japonica]
MVKFDSKYPGRPPPADDARRAPAHLCKQDEEQNRKSRPDEDGIENETMVGIECGIKIRTESMFGIGIRDGAEVRNQSGAS